MKTEKPKTEALEKLRHLKRDDGTDIRDRERSGESPTIRELTAQLDGLTRLVDKNDNAIRDILEERDQRYAERARGLENEFRNTFLAQEKYNAATAEASREAVDKAEDAQKEVNIRTNEFRGQLSDQAATLMPRRETEAEVASLRELLDRESKAHQAEVKGVRELLDRQVASLQADIKSLRESRSEVMGRQAFTDPAMAELLAAVNRLSSNQEHLSGRSYGVDKVVGQITGAMPWLVAIGIAAFVALNK